MSQTARQALLDYLNQARAKPEIKDCKQEKLAAAAGVSQQQISAWLAGERIPHQKYVRGLARAFKVSELELRRLIGEAQAEETAEVRKTNQRIMTKLAKIEVFVDQYEELGHTYRSMSEDISRLLDLLPLFDEINERLSRLEERLPPADPPT